jgi:hypothetical protein
MLVFHSREKNLHLWTKLSNFWVILGQFKPRNGCPADWIVGNSVGITYSFGKMNLEKCELNFMISQTNLAIGSTIFIGIVDWVHYIDHQFYYMLWTSWFSTHIHNFTKSISWMYAFYFTMNGISCKRFS